MTEIHEHLMYKHSEWPAVTTRIIICYCYVVTYSKWMCIYIYICIHICLVLSTSILAMSVNSGKLFLILCTLEYGARNYMKRKNPNNFVPGQDSWYEVAAKSIPSFQRGQSDVPSTSSRPSGEWPGTGFPWYLVTYDIHLILYICICINDHTKRKLT